MAHMANFSGNNSELFLLLSTTAPLQVKTQDLASDAKLLIMTLIPHVLKVCRVSVEMLPLWERAPQVDDHTHKKSNT